MYTFPTAGLVMKKIDRFVISYDIPQSLLQCSMWKWVAYLLNVCILEIKPTDKDLIWIQCCSRIV